MARQDILGALNSALARGETLKQAMMSLFNAGYTKKDIEEAAAALNQITQPQIAQPIQQPQEPKTTHQVINTPPHEKPKSKIKLILIIALLLILVGALISGLLFKSELIAFFNNYFK